MSRPPHQAPKLTRAQWDEQRSARRRKDLLDAATWAIAEHGLDVPINVIASMAQCSTGSHCYHFGDRNGLMRALADHHTDSLIEAISVGVIAKSSPQEQARVAISTTLDHLEAHPNLVRLYGHVVSLADDDPDPAPTAESRLGIQLGLALHLPTDMNPAWRDTIGLMILAALIGWTRATVRMGRDELLDHLLDLARTHAAVPASLPAGGA